jgi:hypothetical protein
MNYGAGPIVGQRELGTPQMMVAVPSSYQNNLVQNTQQSGSYVQNTQGGNRNIFFVWEKMVYRGIHAEFGVDGRSD